MPDPRYDAAVAYIRELHRVVDGLVAPLARAHAGRLHCGRGCSSCCVDDLSVFAVEAERIRREFPQVLAEPAGPPGACGFLAADGACRVYDARPYVCRTQGLPLRWAESGSEARDICPLNEAVSLLALPADACWTLGPVEARLAAVQATIAAEPERRVPLRALFAGG